MVAAEIIWHNCWDVRYQTLGDMGDGRKEESEEGEEPMLII